MSCTKKKSHDIIKKLMEKVFFVIWKIFIGMFAFENILTNVTEITKLHNIISIIIICSHTINVYYMHT